MRLRMVRPNNQQTQELVGDYVQATMTEGMDDAIPSPRSIMVGFVGTSGHSADPVGYLDSEGRLGKVIHTTRHTAHRQPFSGKHACPRRSSSTTLSTLQTTNRWSGTTTFCPTRQVEIVGILCRWHLSGRLALSAHWTHCQPAAWQCPQRRLKGGMGRTSSHVAVRAKSSLGILPRGLTHHHFYCRGCCCIYNKVIVSSLTLMPRPLSTPLAPQRSTPIYILTGLVHLRCPQYIQE